MNPNTHATLTHEPWNKGKLVGQKARKRPLSTVLRYS